MNFGKSLAELRKKHKYTQKEVSEHLGISRAAWSHYENNRRFPDYMTLRSIADFFKVKIDELVSSGEGGDH
ncbi:XRE family transcriptional regulator [Xylanibacillus composti]|uniref:HTH cro/C1-type domain-containing protein n=1 Tax=Xylanibacillus composti TaxID=1572762 RepID=A0A8J4M2V9_9BACL|nr:helix-turn-helix transcriptional regulator [Xylanibacillus composti]MDT9724565.1 XRE family transcriptional regulator [Xylanibacillus composti]GIQ70275.1 hypothetical protein XYCOK13_30990 [Xylanibacillus composti]